MTTRTRPQRQKRIEHTPGPWVTNPNDTYPLQVFNADPAPGRLEICNVGGSGFCPESDEENRANARLIATAPELLDAASWVVRLFGTDHPEGIKDLQQKVRELRDVCKKARGY